MGVETADPGMERLAGARLTVDLAALAANWRLIADRVAPAECGAAVKGDGYGIGIGHAVTTLAQAGCRTFFVALPEEGIRARKAVPDARIFVLNGLIPGIGGDLLAHGLVPVLGSRGEIAEWRELAGRLGRPLPAAIHIDTGMNRLGLREAEAEALAGEPDALAGIETVLVMSHLACASEPDHPLNARQAAAFGRIRELFPGIAGSLANSAGTFLGAAFCHDLVRPGIALYGGAALDEHLAANPMRSVVRLDARILQVRDVPAGEGVGYGSAETAARDSRVAIVATGYADGYHRRAGSSDARKGAYGLVGGRKAPIIGRVSMDLIALDVTGIDGPEPRRGDWATLVGEDPTVDAVARCAETIGYELLTSLGTRYHRHYLPFSP